MLRARRASQNAQKNDLALAAEKFGEATRAELAALVIVSRNRAGRCSGIERRVDDDDGDAGAHRHFGRASQRTRIQRRQHHAAHAAGDEIFHHLHLLLAIIFAQRAFPNDVGIDPFGLQFARSFNRTGVNGFPKLVGRAFGNDRDAIIGSLRHDGDAQRQN